MNDYQSRLSIFSVLKLFSMEMAIVITQLNIIYQDLNIIILNDYSTENILSKECGFAAVLPAPLRYEILT